MALANDKSLAVLLLHILNFSSLYNYGKRKARGNIQ
jgi:hypothetical protein